MQKVLQKQPFITKYSGNQIVLKQQYPLRFTNKLPHKIFLYLKAGIGIGRTSFVQEKKLQGNEQDIINQIHEIRYNASNPYVITGGHFNQIFVRNLGIFFNALLDPRIPSTKKDWHLRQSIVLKTLAHDLEIFSLAGTDFTTITHVNKNLYIGLNIYARPSDSLFAIMYTLHSLRDDMFISRIFPSKASPKHILQTRKAADMLLEKYNKVLSSLIADYHNKLLDEETLLIKKGLLLSSARDGIQRQSSFYDNVILWATVRLAKSLGLYKISNKELADWKKRIIQAYWDAQSGMFLDDVSEECKKEKLFSADSFIVTSTRFLSYENVKERAMLLKMVTYVREHNLDKPFPLHYSSKDLPHRLYRPVRHFAPPYMGTSIWSHWGMEYIKTLYLLSPWDKGFLKEARIHLQLYKNRIEKYGGYPEVYDKNGAILDTRLYRSVLHNGWVINYEQTKMLLKNARK